MQCGFFFRCPQVWILYITCGFYSDENALLRQCGPASGVADVKQKRCSQARDIRQAMLTQSRKAIRSVGAKRAKGGYVSE
jgi:hypothetical protein